ncbi:MAG: FliI/YscN family ATPase [Phycisphaerae bacterium]|nr:FliI/YscN family ATPase [Phycisphaerae bacterium]MDW8261609.1 FliI/YscN family ATPase [Phycisphaerales bacterium]
MSVLESHILAAEATLPFGVRGTVQAVTGLTIEAIDLALPVGSMCRIHTSVGPCAAEVIGFADDRTLLMPLSSPRGVTRGDRVENVASAPRVACGPELLGRVVDGFGRPADQLGPVGARHWRRIDQKSPAPLARLNIRQPLCTSVRAIDALLTCGRGQRMGIFSGPGVGKSTLLSQIARHCDADVSVIALIGERGREVREFLENSLGPEGLKRCVVVVSTSDDPPLLRVRAAKVACTIAEHFRDQGCNVLLLMDSLTRLAQAQRQIGLAAREPPATRGYPPCVFALLPEILERAGRTESGSITGFYTVLVEGDDFNEPIPDAVKGITDGHLWLSRQLANRGHFPAIDVLQSISRVRGDVCDSAQLTMARRIQSLLAVYQDIEDLVNIGAYVAGVNFEYDVAVQSRKRVVEFLRQDAAAPTTLEQARKELTDLVAWIEQVENVVAASGKGVTAPEKRR